MSLCHFNQKAAEYTCETLGWFDAFSYGDITVKTLMFLGWIAALLLIVLAAQLYEERNQKIRDNQQKIQELEKKVEQ